MGKVPKSAFINGVPELLILKMLSRTEMYGYQLIKAVRLSTGEQLELGEGVVYPLLHSLEAEGFLSSRRTHVNGRDRVHYRTTAKGERRLGTMVTQWDRVMGAVSKALAQEGAPSDA